MKPGFIALILIIFFSCTTTHLLVNTGKAYQNKPQKIPGRIECEYYNQGGEGIAYHDADSVNNSSGKLKDLPERVQDARGRGYILYQGP
jgi:hypothetical protein